MTTESTNKRAKRGSKNVTNYHVIVNNSDPIATFKTHRSALKFVNNSVNFTKYNLSTDSVIKVVKEKYCISTISQHQIKPVMALSAVELGLD